MEQIAKHIIFSGRVQGVGFRYMTHRMARHYNLTGYIQNMSDGTVESLMQGSKAGIQSCLDDIKEYFSGYLRETNMTDQPVNLQYHDFRITY